ncbi:hypothetical protein EDD15DRAFT_2198518 [Pisolithus albus]|nr:hypothetical protein EDD15DRAFT_2198518 [Pisolithus albus]
MDIGSSPSERGRAEHDIRTFLCHYTLHDSCPYHTALATLSGVLVKTDSPRTLGRHSTSLVPLVKRATAGSKATLSHFWPVKTLWNSVDRTFRNSQGGDWCGPHFPVATTLAGVPATQVLTIYCKHVRFQSFSRYTGDDARRNEDDLPLKITRRTPMLLLSSNFETTKHSISPLPSSQSFMGLVAHSVFSLSPDILKLSSVFFLRRTG